jgi:molybdenum cofactor guanylyltransferase
MADTDAIRSALTGLVLAGGRAQRMGGQDKGLCQVAGRPMIEHVLEILRPQVSEVIINANRNLETYAAYGCRVVSDHLEGYLGPLAGFASAMRIARTPFILTAPCDSPFLPPDLGPRLYRAMQAEDAEGAVAHDGERMQPVFALLSCSLGPSLRVYLEAGERKIDRWYAEHRLALADFSDAKEAFVNINTPEERAAAEAQLSIPVFP